MKNSIGTDIHAFEREARNARRAQAGISAGGAVPDSACARVAAMIFFCSGQMTIQTFMNMMIPIPPPIAIESTFHEVLAAEWTFQRAAPITISIRR